VSAAPTAVGQSRTGPALPHGLLGAHRATTFDPPDTTKWVRTCTFVASVCAGGPAVAKVT